MDSHCPQLTTINGQWAASASVSLEFETNLNVWDHGQSDRSIELHECLNVRPSDYSVDATNYYYYYYYYYYFMLWGVWVSRLETQCRCWLEVLVVVMMMIRDWIEALYHNWQALKHEEARLHLLLLLLLLLFALRCTSSDGCKYDCNICKIDFNTVMTETCLHVYH